MNEIRCGNCRRKLAEGDYLRLSIKCPRCGTLNFMSAESASPERQGASSKQDALHEKQSATPVL